MSRSCRAVVLVLLVLGGAAAATGAWEADRRLTWSGDQRLTEAPGDSQRVSVAAAGGELYAEVGQGSIPQRQPMLPLSPVLVL